MPSVRRETPTLPGPKSPSRRLMAVAMASALLGIVSATSASLAAAHYIDRVEMRMLSYRSPHRSAHIVRPQPEPAVAVPPQARATAQPVESASSVLDFDPTPSVLAHAGPETHDPAFLVARARRLADAGADVIVASVRLRADTLDEAIRAMVTSPNPARIVPVYSHGRAAGLRIAGARGALFSMAGVRDGDVLLSINGYALDSFDQHSLHLGRSLDERLYVAELARDGHRIVLVVSWPDDRATVQRESRPPEAHTDAGAPVLHHVPTEVAARRRASRSQHGAGTRFEGDARSGGRSAVARAR